MVSLTSLRPSRSRSSLLAACAAVALASAAAHGQFLVDITGGTPILTGFPSFGLEIRDLGFSAQFFGDTAFGVTVNLDGYINAGPSAVILPMFMDLYRYPGDSIIEKAVPGQYYSITWQIGTNSFGHVHHDVQAVIFGAPTTLMGKKFQANDIVFCYKSVGAPPWAANIGLSSNSLTPHVRVPGNTTGQITHADSALLPIFGQTGQVLLFRPDGAGSYTSQVYPCPADVNKDGVATVQDIFDMLNAWFAGCP